MAKLEIVRDNRPSWLDPEVVDIYTDMISKLGPVIGEEYKVNNWKMAITGSEVGAKVSIKGPGFSLERSFDRGGRSIGHDFFELSPKLQGKGIAGTVLETTVKVSDKIGFTEVKLHANLDVGGYAWLRKGFMPEDLTEDLFNRSGLRGKRKELAKEFDRIVLTMKPEELRGYFLSEDFRRFKPLFLKSDWYGSTDLQDPISRAAFSKSTNEAYRMYARQIGPPGTANEKVLDGMVRHQTYLMRYSAALKKDTTGKLVDTEKELRAYLMSFTEDMEGLNPTSKEAVAKFKKMEAHIKKVRAEAWDQISSSIPEEAIAMASYEAGATLAVIEGAFPVVLGLQPLSINHIKRIVSAQPFEGRTLSEWLGYNQEIDAQRITRTAKAAIVRGETPTQVARAAMGTKALDYKDGQARKAFRDAEAVYLTVVNGINNQVKVDLYAENSDIIEKVMFVATLDIVTTLECAANDGKVFVNGEAPVPPMHFRCRSLLVPYVDPENLGNRPFKGSTEKQLLKEFAEENDLKTMQSADNLPRGYKTKYNAWARTRKNELVGQVPATQNFDTWLRNQPVEFQNEYLGPGRADIFREGKLSLDKFVTRDGYELPIAELKKLTK